MSNTAITERMARKAALIDELSHEKAGHSWSITKELLNILIQELRENNDTADTDSFRSNQGRIEAYKHLLIMIDRGIIPLPNKQ